MPRVKIVDENLIVEIWNKNSTTGELIGRATEILDCRRNTGNWLPDMTEVAPAIVTPEMTTTEPTR